MQRICVFCGSRPGIRSDYAIAARALGAALVRAGLTLVYGGGRVGIMGVIADEVIARGGEVIGVIPRPLWKREVGHGGVADLRVVESMHERKALFAELSDGFVALPGGIGTLEEIFEVWTWSQLGVHSKPVGFLDVGGYYGPLFEFLDQGVAEGFIDSRTRNTLIVEREPEALLARFAAYRPPDVRQWIEREET